MRRAYMPPMKPIPEGATKEDRKKLYDEYMQELRELNPHCFNEDGSVKSAWQTFMDSIEACLFGKR